MVLEPPGLDPTSGTAAATDEVTYANIFEGLTRIDETAPCSPTSPSPGTSRTTA